MCYNRVSLLKKKENHVKKREIMLKIVGISDMFISDDPMETVVTYSLGSCVGLSIYDPVVKVGGIIHCMLPLSKIDKEKAKIKPYMFTDTGVTYFLQELFNRGVTKKNMIVKVAGCSSLLDAKGTFKIGERNYTVARKVLWKNQILIATEHVKGNLSRTLSLYMETGVTTIKSSGKEFEI